VIINLALRYNVPILPYTFASRLDTWCLGPFFCHSLLLRVKVAFCRITLDMGGRGGSRHQTDKHLPQDPFTGQFV
jgi:hypothetical protein